MNQRRYLLILTVYLSLPWFIYSQPGPYPLFEKINPQKCGIKFNNALNETNNYNMLSFINFYSGAGVGILDLNNDGLQDIFFAGNQVTSRLYLNKGGFKFEDITKNSGIKTDRWITGVSIIDINQDGFDDIYLSVSGSGEAGNLLFVNNKNNTFTEKADEFNLNIKEQTTHTSFFDYDHDGYLDAFCATNPTDFKLNSTDLLLRPKTNGESRGTDILIHNDRNGTFTDVSKNSGILMEGYSLGVNTSDFNQDGWTDIYISNDYISNDILYINNGNGTFTNKLGRYFSNTSFASMGNDAGDVNNDGLVDLITLDMVPESSYRQKLIVGSSNYKGFIYTASLGYFPQYNRNMLQLNNGNNIFSEIGRLAGIYKSDWTWAPLIVDLDNDGFKDIFVTTGIRRDMGNLDFIHKTDDSPFKRGGVPVPVPEQLEAIKRFDGVPVMNYAFRNNGDLSFTNVSEMWGFDEKTYSYGVASADLDNDGDLDIIISNIDSYASIYENKANLLGNHYLKIILNGPVKNRTGIGSKVCIYYQGYMQFVENNPYRGYMSTIEKNIFFGTGKHTLIDSLIVIWPDGSCSRRYKVPVDAEINFDYKSGPKPDFSEYTKRSMVQMFKEVSSQHGILYKHKEDPFIDFYKQPLLPHMFSQLGPAVAVGDINGDGLEDFFVGGSPEHHATLFYQTPKSSFMSREFPFDQEHLDMGTLLFDFDGDGDLDIYVVSGGSFAEKNSVRYQDRLYINNGKGVFIKSENVLPDETSSGSVVTASDFDKDGDLDLFVGGRIIPSGYPLPPRSYLLENRNGKFIDVTNEKAPGLSNIGMVTSAVWSDMNGDGNIDLLLVGEWMPVTIFENERGFFRNQTAKNGLTNSTGWWNSICPCILDESGNVSYILGNLSLNNSYFTSSAAPLKVVFKDFNNDGITDPILTMMYPDGYFPVASRFQFLSVFPQKVKKYESYDSYARTTSEGLLRDLGIDNAQYLDARVFANSVLINRRDSLPLLKPLPNKGQFAPIFGMVNMDLNNDKKDEVLFVGNFYPNNVADGPYTASTGGIISSPGNNNFEVYQGHENGFNIHSDARALASLILGNQKRILIVTSNNDSLKVYQPLHQMEKHIKLRYLDAYAIIEWDNGIKEKREFYYGTGYLSQSSRYLSVSKGWKRIKIFTYSGEEMVITPD